MMKIERLTKKDAAMAMGAWIADSFNLPTLNKEYAQIRIDINELFEQSLDECDDDDPKSYEMDVRFGSALYGYFKTKSWFTERLASDDGFWRYLSLKVVPDIVGKRWGNDNADHFYTKPSRIWLKTMWWFVHLSLQKNDLNDTIDLLLSGNFSTDTILNLVERTGRGGTNVSVYRAIMYTYHTLDGVADKDFRKVMKLNTAKSVVMEPNFCEGGSDGYVKSLFVELSLS